MEPVNYVVSVGKACPCACAIMSAGLKEFSCPFDWIVSSPWMVESCIDDGFKAYLDRSQYYHTPNRHGSYCHHKAYGLGVFNHHCPLHNKEHYAYLQRCVERFNTVRNSIGVLYVYMDIVKEPDEWFVSKVQHLQEVLGGRVLGVQCIEGCAKRQCTVRADTPGYRAVEVCCKGHNTGVRLSDKKDNDAVASVLRWYTYDLKRLDGDKERRVWPYTQKRPWWRKALSCFRT